MKYFVNIVIGFVIVVLLVTSTYFSSQSIAQILNIIAVILICMLLMRIFKFKRLDE